MRAIFVSYRREDAEGEAGRLFDDLVGVFGEHSVFMDVAAIEVGRDFRKAIDESVATCGVLLAIIGKDWADARNQAGQRRLEDTADFVRLETASALKRDIPVIPVLVHGARMPRADQLPDDLKELAYRNGVELTHARWGSDVQLLIKALRPYVDESKSVPAGASEAGAGAAAVRGASARVTATARQDEVGASPTPTMPRGVILGLVAAVLVAGALGAYMLLPKRVTVPDLSGTPLTDATAKLQALKLAVGQTTLKEDATRETNTVLSQSPAANAQVKSGAMVDLVVSQLPQQAVMVEVPRVVGKSLDAARQALEDRQLVVGDITREPRTDKPQATVLSEFPDAGGKVKAGSKVSLLVSDVPAPAPGTTNTDSTGADKGGQKPPGKLTAERAVAQIAAAGTVSIMNANSRLCISPAGGADGKNVQVVQFLCDQDPSRLWSFAEVEGDTMKIRNFKTSLCLTVAGGGTDRNVVSVQYFCDNDPSRRWRYALVDETTFRLVNVHSGLCLTIAGGGTDRNTTAVQFPCDGDPSRDWKITNPQHK